jgi:hypothetical protein
MGLMSGHQEPGRLPDPAGLSDLASTETDPTAQPDAVGKLGRRLSYKTF